MPWSNLDTPGKWNDRRGWRGPAPKGAAVAPGSRCHARGLGTGCRCATPTAAATERDWVRASRDDPDHHGIPHFRRPRRMRRVLAEWLRHGEGAVRRRGAGSDAVQAAAPTPHRDHWHACGRMPVRCSCEGDSRLPRSCHWLWGRTRRSAGSVCTVGELKRCPDTTTPGFFHPSPRLEVSGRLAS